MLIKWFEFIYIQKSKYLLRRLSFPWTLINKKANHLFDITPKWLGLRAFISRISLECLWVFLSVTVFLMFPEFFSKDSKYVHRLTFSSVLIFTRIF